MSDVSNKLATVSQVKSVKDRIVQSDWNETNTNSMAYIKNLPRGYASFSSTTPLGQAADSYGNVTINKSELSDYDWEVAHEFNQYLGLYKDDKYIRSFNCDEMQKSIERGDISYSLPENYGQVTISDRTNAIHISPNGKDYNRVEFRGITYYLATGDCYPFYNSLRLPLAQPNKDIVIAYGKSEKEVIPCDSVRVTDSNGDVTQKYTVGVTDNTITLTPEKDEEDSTLYFRYANDSLYFADVTAPGTATVTETRLTVDEATELVAKAHTTNIIIFSSDTVFPTSNGVVYTVLDAYMVYGYHYFTVVKSDRVNNTSAVDVLCVRSYDRDR